MFESYLFYTDTIYHYFAFCDEKINQSEGDLMVNVMIDGDALHSDQGKVEKKYTIEIMLPEDERKVYHRKKDMTIYKYDNYDEHDILVGVWDAKTITQNKCIECWTPKHIDLNDKTYLLQLKE